MTNHAAPRTVEIVGPAGAGKSTLCQVLVQESQTVRPENFPDVRKIASAPFFLWHGLQLLPHSLRFFQPDSGFIHRREFAWLTILLGWPGILQKRLKNDQVILLDQGPVYLMTELTEFGAESLRNQAAEKMWQRIYNRWTNTLDGIVWLDAADSDLLNRIRRRDKEHVVKNESDETTLAFLNRYRKAYARIISNWSANRPALKIIRFDTSRKSPEEIASQLLFEFNST